MDLRAAQFQRNSEILKKYIPEKVVPVIAGWIVEYDFKLKVARERNTRLGDYSSPRDGMNHVITVNHNLNKYQFLITLVHEVAHLVTWNEHKNKVYPHGKEWKQNFQKLMHQFLTPDIFPLEVFSALRKYMLNPAASSCTDANLLKVLKLHDEDSSTIFLEHIPGGSAFLYSKNRVFIKGNRVRKRYSCTELKSGAVYFFDPLTEVELFEQINAQ